MAASQTSVTLRLVLPLRLLLKEVKRFHRALKILSWGRWHAIKAVAKLHKRSVVQIKLFARVYMQVRARC